MGEWKDTELGPLPENWDVASFETMLKDGFLSYGVVQPGQEVADGVPMIRVNNITNGQVVLDQVLRIEPSREQAHAKTRLNGDELLISVVGSLGDTVLCDERLKGFNVARAIAVARFENDDDRRWASYALKVPEVKASILSFANTTVQPTLNLKELRGIPIPLPPPSERKAIASVLSSLDAKIDLLHRQNKTLEAMAEALFRQWFVEEAEEGWPWEQLGGHVEVLRGLSYSGAGLCEKGEGVPMHNLNSIYEGGGYKYDGVKYYKGDYKDRHIVLPGDVLVSNTEQGHDQLLIGCPAIVPAYFGEAGIFSQHVYKLNLLDPTFSNVFVKQLLLSADVREQLTGSTNGSTVNMLPKDGIEMAKFQMPPKEKIVRFNAIAAPLHLKQEKNYSQIQTLIAQRDTLLPKLMSGEVRVVQEQQAHGA